MGITGTTVNREPWNKGKIVGQKAPFKLKDIWALRVRLQMDHRVRELALFNLGIDSKLRGCDLVSLRVRDVCHGDQVATRAATCGHRRGAIKAAARPCVATGLKLIIAAHKNAPGRRVAERSQSFVGRTGWVGRPRSCTTTAPRSMCRRHSVVAQGRE